MTGHAAIVLAAGGSRRLGRPKQLLTRGGETLVHRMVRLALETAPSRLVVVTGAHAMSVEGAIAGLAGVECVRNPQWNEGMASSLRRAAQVLAEARSAEANGHVLILACDQPALEAHHLQALLQGAARSPDACVATVHGERLGIPVVVTRSLLASARNLGGDRGLGGRLTALRSVWRLHAPELALDIDTTQDVAQAVQNGWLDPAG
ncbi:nucleotidyltransferase family protein [Lysobacter sp.]|uniref:nucleotidyltransferase family protein n=1 Tax=Lysobacter sp. TaxID=72226 RepID=UPI002D6172AC|nr:nucleotidyltransferase family protein [Lysobacter sp.]HZX78568.1 nucleotidyltransferase family protein [Lysobacter sp.]